MISESVELKLIKPLVENQLKIEGVVIGAIADRLKELKTLTPSDISRLEVLLRSGSDARKINKKISQLTKLSEKEIKKIIKTVAKDSYLDAKPFYDYRNKSFIPFEQNVELQKTVKAIENVTLKEYTRLSNATAFMLRDLTNPSIVRPTKVSQLYNKIIDNAIQTALSGTDTYGQLIPNAIQQLVDSGIKTVEYTTEGGKKHYRRLDSVVKQNILDGIKAVRQEVQNITGEQFGANGVELSVHRYSAPDHEPVQGHQFTKEEFEKMQNGQSFEDVNGKQFESFERPIGMWRCRHIAWNIIIGHKTPNYTNEQLEELKTKNANGITVKDKTGNKVKKSMYWCTQKRNTYELQIRQLKEGLAAAEKIEHTDIIQKYNNKLNKKINEYRYFCNQCGLKTRFENTRIFV